MRAAEYEKWEPPIRKPIAKLHSTVPATVLNKSFGLQACTKGDEFLAATCRDAFCHHALEFSRCATGAVFVIPAALQCLS